MRVAITGASGLIGRAISRALAERGDEPVPLRRDGEGLRWSTSGLVPPGGLSGFDAVVHLAGESIGSGRWSQRRKREIRDSRVLGTRAIVRALDVARPRPRTLICASAVGGYGEGGDTILHDDAPLGDTFLAEVVRAWELEAHAAAALGVRVAMPRFGLVLSADGGLLTRMLPPFRLGLGGPLGEGGQYMSWVHIADLVAAVLHALDGHIDGPFNCLAPGPVTNRAFTRTLAGVLRRPAFLPVPRFALRLALGDLADGILESQRAVPDRLLHSGFSFRFPELGGALTDVLG